MVCQKNLERADKMNDKWSEFIHEEDLEIAGIVICLNKDRQFLIIRRSNTDPKGRGGQWTIPGGHIDSEDNSIEKGAVRELKEETGLSCNISDLTYLGEPKKGKYYFLTLNWVGAVDVNIPNPKTGVIEHDSYKWADIKEIKGIENTEIPIYLLEEALQTLGFSDNG